MELTTQQRALLASLDVAVRSAPTSVRVQNQIKVLQSAIFNPTEALIDSSVVADAGITPPIFPPDSNTTELAKVSPTQAPLKPSNEKTQPATAPQQDPLEIKKAPWIYISKLVKTELPGYTITPEPYAPTDFGRGGTMYNPRLDSTQGVIYLKRYLANNEDESADSAKGAEWRFQYAPADNKWAREGNYQQDSTWSTNQQPYHYKNTSGKVFDLNAIMEGYTLDRSIEGAIKALERMISVNVNAPDQPQLSPYAFRLIIGGKTVSDPVTGIHIPFLITQLSILEKSYDVRGNLMECTINLTLREVPAYQVNFGRKLNLVAASTSPIANSDKCPGLIAEYVKLRTMIKEINEYYKGVRNNNFKNGTDYSPGNLNDKEREELGKKCSTQSQNYIAAKKAEDTLRKNCPDAKGVKFGEIDELYREPYKNKDGLFESARQTYGVQYNNTDLFRVLKLPTECLPADDTKQSAGTLTTACYQISKGDLLVYQRTFDSEGKLTSVGTSQGCLACADVPDFYKGAVTAPFGNGRNTDTCTANILAYWNALNANIDSSSQTEAQKLYAKQNLRNSMIAERRDFQNFLVQNFQKDFSPIFYRKWTTRTSCNGNADNINACQAYVSINEVVNGLDKLIGTTPASSTGNTSTTTPVGP